MFPRFPRFPQIISFFNLFSRTSSDTSANEPATEPIVASASGDPTSSISTAIKTLSSKFEKGSRPTGWDLKELTKIELDIKSSQGSLHKEELLKNLSSLSVSAQKASQNAGTISAYASRIFNWSDKPSWESFNSKLGEVQKYVDIEIPKKPVDGEIISPKKPLGGNDTRFQITKSPDSTIAVLSGSTFTGDEQDRLEPGTRNFDSSVSRVLKKQDEIIGGVVASADGWGRASDEYGNKIDEAGMAGCRVLSYYLSSLESSELLTQELANEIVQQCDQAITSCDVSANLAGVRIFPGENENCVQIAGVSVGNQRILAVHADTGKVHSLNNENSDDDSTCKICLGAEADAVKYKEKDVEVINKKIPIPKEKCIIFIATDGAWHNLPKAKDNPSQLDLDGIAQGVFNDNSPGSLELTPEKVAGCLKRRIEEKSKEIRGEQKDLEEKIKKLSSLTDRIKAAQRLEDVLKDQDCLSGVTQINGRLGSLATAQGKPKGNNPVLEDFEIPQSWDDLLVENKESLKDLKTKISDALRKAKEELEDELKNMGIGNFNWDSDPSENLKSNLSEQEQSKDHWNSKALDDATVTVIAPWL